MTVCYHSDTFHSRYLSLIIGTRCLSVISPGGCLVQHNSLWIVSFTKMLINMNYLYKSGWCNHATEKVSITLPVKHIFLSFSLREPSQIKASIILKVGFAAHCDNDSDQTVVSQAPVHIYLLSSLHGGSVAVRTQTCGICWLHYELQ